MSQAGLSPSLSARFISAYPETVPASHSIEYKNFIIVPRAHMNMTSRSFHYKGAVVWNTLPDDIKGVNRGSTFSHALKLFYASSCNYCTILAYCVQLM